MTINISSIGPAGACPPPCVDCRLRRTDTFTPLAPDTIDFIDGFRHGTTLVDAGATIVQEQQPSGKLFTLYSGWAFRYRSLSDGRRQILNFLLPGDVLGLQQEFSSTAMHGI